MESGNKPYCIRFTLKIFVKLLVSVADRFANADHPHIFWGTYFVHNRISKYINYVRALYLLNSHGVISKAVETATVFHTIRLDF